LRAFNHIKQLSKRHEIILFALNDPNSPTNDKAVKVLEEYCSEVHIHNLSNFGIIANMKRAFFLGLPLQVGYFYSTSAKAILKSLIERQKPDHIYCQLLRTAEYVKDITDIPKTIDYMDAFSKGVERRMPEAPFYLKPMLKIEYKRLLKYENKIMSWFNNASIISEQDRHHMNHPGKERIKIIPNGVDLEYFQPLEREKTCDILFSGNMSYPPNVDAAIYLVKKIFPIVLKERPNTRLVIGGTNPTRKVRALASGNVEVTGWVEDIRECYAKTVLFVAPMQTSIGMQNKILEVMAMKIPCITSNMANNAINAEVGQSILIGNNAQDYSHHIITLLNNAGMRDQLALSGHKFVTSNYSWEASTHELERFFA